LANCKASIDLVALSPSVYSRLCCSHSIRFINDGSIELDNNTVERSIRGVKASRKNALFDKFQR
jgi:hypothetical protein